MQFDQTVRIRKDGNDYRVEVLGFGESVQDYEIAPSYEIALRLKREFMNTIKEETITHVYE